MKCTLYTCRTLSRRYQSLSTIYPCLVRTPRECARDAITARATQPAAGDHVPAMSAPHAFALTVKSKRRRL